MLLVRLQPHTRSSESLACWKQAYHSDGHKEKHLRCSVICGEVSIQQPTTPQALGHHHCDDMKRWDAVPCAYADGMISLQSRLPCNR